MKLRKQLEQLACFDFSSTDKQLYFPTGTNRPVGIFGDYLRAGTAVVVWVTSLRRDGGLIYLCSAGCKPRLAFCILSRSDGFHRSPRLFHPFALWSEMMSAASSQAPYRSLPRKARKLVHSAAPPSPAQSPIARGPQATATFPAHRGAKV